MVACPKQGVKWQSVQDRGGARGLQDRQRVHLLHVHTQEQRANANIQPWMPVLWEVHTRHLLTQSAYRVLPWQEWPAGTSRLNAGMAQQASPGTETKPQ